jgi:hypothetical protein
MRNSVSIAAVLVLIGVSQLSFVGPLIGQEHASNETRIAAHRQWAAIANGRTEFDVADPELVPTHLALALSRTACRWKDVIKEAPLQFFSVENQRLAKVTCFGFGYWHQIFDLSALTNPKALQLPVVSTEGFKATGRLGSIAWNPESKLLESVGSSDQCGGPGVRHTYRWIDREFSVIRVELSPENCGGRGPWTTIWEAPQWTLIQRPKGP